MSGPCKYPGCERYSQDWGLCRTHARESGLFAESFDRSDRFMTRQEIADELGITNQAVWQIEQRALVKLRRQMRIRGLKFEDLVGV